MAALLISCTGLFYEKIRDKRRAKKANKLELEKNFDEMKAANAERHSRISSTRNSTRSAASVSNSVSEGMFDAEPPSYEDVASLPSNTKLDARRVGAVGDGQSDLLNGGSGGGVHRQDVSRLDSTQYSASDRIGTRDMAGN